MNIIISDEADLFVIINCLDIQTRISRPTNSFSMFYINSSIATTHILVLLRNCMTHWLKAIMIPLTVKTRTHLTLDHINIHTK